MGEKTRSATKIEINKVPGPTFGKKINCKTQTAINKATPKAYDT